MSPEALAEFRALYRDDGPAGSVLASARQRLLSHSGPSEPYELGRLRGQVEALENLRLVVDGVSEKEAEGRRETDDEELAPAGTPRWPTTFHRRVL